MNELMDEGSNQTVDQRVQDGDWHCLRAPARSPNLGLPAGLLSEMTHSSNLRRRKVKEGGARKVAKQHFQPTLQCKYPQEAVFQSPLR